MATLFQQRSINMTIKVGDTLPSGTLQQYQDGPQAVSTEEFFKGRKVVLFAVPGAFTPTCSARHLPGYVDELAAFKAKGVDAVACMAVNDAFVMGAWGKSQNVPAELTLLADGNAAWTKALGLELDATGFGMGVRAQRFALVADDGKVTHLFVEQPGEFRVSAADAVLAAL
jgi:peroxiredoxin